MGNCFARKKSTAINNNKHFSEIAPSSSSEQPPPSAVLRGDTSDVATHFLRFALRYKSLTLRFDNSGEKGAFTLRFENSGENVTGDVDAVLRFADLKLPHPPLRRKLAGDAAAEETAAAVVRRMVELQHRSARWQVERVARWAADIATRGGGKVAVDPRMGTAKMEVSKLGKSYGKLVEVLQEHAQMEERIIFPILDAHDPGLCRSVNEEHARDLPIMNGIKEDIKSIGVMNTGSPTHREALYSLSKRLKTFQDNCRGHFNEEEQQLFPILEAAELTRKQQKKIVEQCIDVMQGTHSHLFPFFIEGLLPHEAIEYLDLIMACVNKERASSMLQLLLD